MASQRLLLTCRFSVGDIVMLTAAVRDLHRAYPGKFTTAVRTSCSEIWEGNPWVSDASEDDGWQTIPCDYPLIHRANEDGRHCLHGFIDFLNDRLNLNITLTEPRGHVVLREDERRGRAPLAEWTGGGAMPYWLVSAGGKYDLTTKWWPSGSYQEVVDRFRGRIQFVQVGKAEHWHPPLDGVIDLRGRTSLRQLIRLVYHAQGVLCPVTGLMHLAAAVERQAGQAGDRPCVVVAGGREPPHWEAYPGHLFLHTIGQLECCQQYGCWKARAVPLGDGDPRDEPKNLCVDVVERTPRCLQMVTPDDVVAAIESYYESGACQYLTRRMVERGWRGADASRQAKFDARRLVLSRVRLEVEGWVEAIRAASQPKEMGSRGIVLCAGGPVFGAFAWIVIHRLRELGCQLPIEFWSFRREAVEHEYCKTLERMKVRFRSPAETRSRLPFRALANVQALKCYALLASDFDEALLLDADCLPLENPTRLFEDSVYLKHGCLFWPQAGHGRQSDTIRHSLQLARPVGDAWDLGASLWNLRQCQKVLSLANRFWGHFDFFCHHFDATGLLRAVWEIMGSEPGIHSAAVELVDGGHLLPTSAGRKGFLHLCERRSRAAIEALPGRSDILGNVAALIERFDRIWCGSCEPVLFAAQQWRARFPDATRALWHVVAEIHIDDPETSRQRAMAQEAWTQHYRTAHWIRVGIRLEDLPRVFRDGQFRFPFLRDVLNAGFAGTQRQDVVVLTDAELLPCTDLTERLVTLMGAREAGWGTGHELASPKKAPGDRRIKSGEPLKHASFVALSRAWWSEHREELPDLVMGVEGWAECLIAMIERSVGREGLMDGVVFRSQAEVEWQQIGATQALLAQRYNETLFEAFFRDCPG